MQISRRKSPLFLISSIFLMISLVGITPVYAAQSATELVPEIAVTGNSNPIEDGALSPTSTNHTEFGSADITTGSIDRTFTIENSGNADLILSGDPKVVIGGDNAADFSVTTQPTSPIASTSSTTFTVHFDPSAVGIRRANISITNNDGNENPYNFNILGTGTTTEVDSTAPTVVSIVRDSPNPTDAALVKFKVTFSEAVKEVGVNDFSLTTTGVAGASVSGVTGSGKIYLVGVDTGSGSGTIQLVIPASATIMDLASNPLSGLPFTTDGFYTVNKNSSFDDVPSDFWANGFIERLFEDGITSGCGDGAFCADDTVTRAQMAIFLLKDMHGSSYVPPAVGDNTGFADVPVDYWAAAWIKELAAEGITSGCGNDNFCPEDTVTRAQMAVFLLKAKYGSTYTPPVLGGDTGFGDLEINHWAAAYIRQLVTDGITSGCGNGNFCSDADVTRAQMAVFLVKTFDSK